MKLPVIVFLLALLQIAKAKYGVVIWHGMGDTGWNPAFQHFSKLITEKTNSNYVKIVILGKSMNEDVESGFFGKVQTQLETICKEINDDDKFNQGIHMIGLSQGGLFVRALAQSCRFKGNIGSVISIGAPQQGIFGIPKCPPGNYYICKLIDKLLSYEAYTSMLQNSIIQGQYWQDPLKKAIYVEKSGFLAEFNKERESKADIKGLEEVENLVLVKFTKDSIVMPRESEWFGFFEENNLQNILTMNETDLYKNDRIGLKKLNEDGRLHLLTVDGDHLEFSMKWFEDLIKRFL